MPFKQKDFIEIEFTGKVKDGEIFDSNIKEDLKKINSTTKSKPFVFCLGEDMFLKGIDDFLIGKEIGKYEIELSPEKAFGKRNPSLIQLIPMKVFQGQNTQPVPGAMFNFDGRPARILTVSGGRVMADFNNPLAGKEVVYNVNAKRKIEDLNEKIKSLIEFFFRKELEFEVKDKKIILKLEKSLAGFAAMFKDKFKDVLGLELDVEEIKDSIKKSQ